VLDADALDALAAQRARRWWLTARRVGSIERAAAFLDDIDLALLFPKERIALPSLWEAIAGDEATAFAHGFGRLEARIWTWKDELPRRGLAWYGKLVRGQRSFLSPALVNDLYGGRGRADDYRSLGLGPDAQRVAAALAAGGATPAPVLRHAAGLDGKAGKARFDRALLELARHVLVTTCGVYEADAGWPATILELTSRLFAVGDGPDLVGAARRVLATTLELTAPTLARTFRWTPRDAAAALDALVREGTATVDGSTYQWSG
jgi:hypothetical protein